MGGVLWLTTLSTLQRTFTRKSRNQTGHTSACELLRGSMLVAAILEANSKHTLELLGDGLHELA